MGTDRRWIGSWLGGTRAAGVDLGYPGERLGMPETGPGSVARFGRRLAAIVIDWLASAMLIRAWFADQDQSWYSAATLGLFALQNVVLISTIRSTVGMRLLGIRVVALGGGQPGLFPVVTRTLLLCLAVPALIWDADQRGLHDKAAGTVVVTS